MSALDSRHGLQVTFVEGNEGASFSPAYSRLHTYSGFSSVTGDDDRKGRKKDKQKKQIFDDSRNNYGVEYNTGNQGYGRPPIQTNYQQVSHSKYYLFIFEMGGRRLRQQSVVLLHQWQAPFCISHIFSCTKNDTLFS